MMKIVVPARIQVGEFEFDTELDVWYEMTEGGAVATGFDHIAFTADAALALEDFLNGMYNGD